MTAPGDLQFVNAGGLPPEPGNEPLEQVAALAAPVEGVAQTYPDPIVKGITEETKDKLKIWLDQWLQELLADQLPRQEAWAKLEAAYRGEDDGTISSPPFRGGCVDVIPVMAMAVDPIHARLDTGVFKQDPVFTLKPLTKAAGQYTTSLAQFIDFYQRHKLAFRRVASPRILEMAKLGTCVFKIMYDREVRRVVTYNERYEVIKRDDVVFAGPRVFGVSLGDALFPPGYQYLQDCPVFFERQRLTIEQLRVLEHNHKLTNVDAVVGQEGAYNKNALETAREESAGHKTTRIGTSKDIIVYEGWCDYDVNNDGLPERVVVTYEPNTRTILQLRYNWYFHQRKPYVLIPYTISNETLFGLGIGEMTYPFQKAISRFHRMAEDNAYLANIRMFIARKNGGIEETPRLYAGRTFFVDEPTKDFIPFQAGDIYPSTLGERQNLFGMVEKRTGVNDYLTGRESPIIGTRATATSTLALIREGLSRVEEVLENVRYGFAEIINFCMALWIQYGTDGLEDIVFGDDKIAADVKAFFAQATQQNVNGMIGIELTATDPSLNRVSMQQMQLQIIQVMMQYLEKVLEAGQAALQARQTLPEYTEMVKEVMHAARQMFLDLLKKYDIRNPDDYLPDLEKFLNAQPPVGGQPAIPGPEGGPGSAGGVPGLPASAGALPRPVVPSPAAPGSGRITG